MKDYTSRKSVMNTSKDNPLTTLVSTIYERNDSVILVYGLEIKEKVFKRLITISTGNERKG